MILRVLMLAMLVPFLFILFVRTVPHLGKLWMKTLTWDPFKKDSVDGKDETEDSEDYEQQDNGPI